MTDRVTIAVTDHVADVRLNRPDKLNALDGEMFDALIAAGKKVGSTPGVRAVAGECFCANLTGRGRPRAGARLC